MDGTAGPSVTASMLETVQKLTDEDEARAQEEIVRNVIGITYGG